MSLPHRECTARRPRRRSESSMMSSWTSVAVWMNSTTAAYRIDAIALVARQPRGHQQHGRTDPLAAARADVLADLRDQIDLRLDVARELRDRPARGRRGSARRSATGRATTFPQRFRSELYHGRNKRVEVRGRARGQVARRRARAGRPARPRRGRRTPARFACRDTAPARETGCRFRSAADRAARGGPSRGAARPSET